MIAIPGRNDGSHARAVVYAVEVCDFEGLPSWGRTRGIDISGGFGSDLAIDPADPGLIRLLTDRGPNVDAGPRRKMFPVPGFVPCVGAFRAADGVLRLEHVVPLRDENGNPLSGLPPAAKGGLAETAIDLNGNVLADDGRGVDPEGFAPLPDGSFWTAEEYGPALLHHDADGRIRRRVLPGTGDWSLPRALLERRPNYGFEGITLLDDGHTLAAVVQGVLATDENKTAARVVLLDTRTGRVRELLYPLDSPRTFPSGICGAGRNAALVLEHDGLVPADAARPAWCKRVYRVRIPETGDSGDDAGPATLTKALFIDLLALGYPHDKPEGLALADARTLLVVNDDDFGISAGADGSIVEKRLPALGGRDRNQLWRISFTAAG